MSECCSRSAVPPNGPVRCPVSGTRAAAVELQTVKALLTEAALRRVATAEYRFCSAPGCHVVYFTEDGQVYATTDLRVPVWQKEPSGSRTVCYCFGENEADMRAEFALNGTCEAVARVRAHIQAGRCACEVRNPRGVCCLGDVSAAVKRAGASAFPGAGVTE